MPNTPEDMESMLRLGLTVVDVAQAQSDMLVQRGDELFEEIPGAIIEETGEQMIGEAVTSHQALLNNLVTSERQKTAFIRVLDELQPPEALKSFLSAKDTAGIVEQVLTRQDQPRTIANFFEWYNYALDERKQKFDEQEKPALLSYFDTHLIAAAQAGIVPGFLPERMQRLRASGKLHVKLAEHSLLIGDGGGTGGSLHFADGEELIWLQLGAEGDREHTFIHEGLHPLEGTANQPGGETGVDTNRGNRGLYRLFGPTKGAVVINEAVIEHTADSVLHGNVEVTLPTSEKREHSISYVANRFLLHVLCEKGVHPISPRFFIDAAFEDGTAEESPAAQLLKEQLDSAFPGFNVIERLNTINVEATDQRGIADFLRSFVEDWGRSREQARQPGATATPSQPSAEAPTTSSQRSARSASGPKGAFEQLVNMPGFEQVLLRFLINNQGTVTESKPPRPVAEPGVVESINMEAAKLRKQGKSEKSAYRTLAKKYHSDVNNNPEAAEKMRVVSTRLESANREAGRKAKQAEASE